MATRDLGVNPDYMDRAFRALEDRVNERPGDKSYFWATRRLQRAQIHDLTAIQANRPLKPPGSGGNFAHVGPLTAKALELRRADEEKRRNSR